MGKPKFLVNLRRKLRVCKTCEREEDGDYYLMARPNSKVIHAVTSRFAAIGVFGMDQMFGGGVRVLCGQKADGDALLSPGLQPARHVNCKKCKAALRRLDG